MIQDWDISIPRAFNFDGLMGYEVSGVPTMWLKTGTLQGQVYEQLFVSLTGSPFANGTLTSSQI